MQLVPLTRIHRILVAVVVTGALIIAAIGFAGSYSAVRALAEQKGFGAFAPFFPIGVDAGIVVLLALDLLLTWVRIPFPMLRQAAWLLTAATIAFNGAAAWPDPLGVGMHAVIPVLFVVSVEAARHAIGRMADITADKHMEGVRVSRWLLAFPSTFRLWRRMKLWELRSYDEVIRMEQDRLVYEARLQARFGRNWRRRAPVESLMPLKLARYGVPLAQTGPAGLAAAGIEAPALTPAALSSLRNEGERAAEEGELGQLARTWSELPELSSPEDSSADAETVPPEEHAATAADEAAPTDTAAADQEAAPRVEPLEELEGEGGTPLEDLEHLDAETWNEHDLPGPELSDVQEAQMERAVAATTGGGPTPAVVHARLPDDLFLESETDPEPPRNGLDAPGDAEHAPGNLEQPEPGPEMEEPNPVAEGRAGLKRLYYELPELERRRSASDLARQLAPQTNLSVGTTRKYLGEFKKRQDSLTTG